MKEKSQLIFPFKYNIRPDNGDFYGIHADETYNFLPYVKSFFNDGSVKQLSILPVEIPLEGTLCFKTSYKSFEKNITDIFFQNAQIYFFDKNIAILSIVFRTSSDKSKELMSRILKAFTDIGNHNDARFLSLLAKNTYSIIDPIENNEHVEIFGNVKVFVDKKNKHTVVSDFRCDEGELIENQAIVNAIENNKKSFYQKIEHAPNIQQWIMSIIEPYIETFSEANFLNHSKLTLYSIVLLDEEHNDIDNFVEALLLGYSYEESDNSIEIVKKYQYSSKIDVYSNLNGVVIIGKDSKNEYMKYSFFDQFSKNIMLIYLFVLLQKARLVQLINDADRVHADDNDRNFKDDLLEYLIHIDFTQLSNNPARNNIYKFFRETNFIKDLLEETKTITDFFTRKEEIADRLYDQQKVHRLEWMLGLLGLLGSIIGIYGNEMKDFINNFGNFIFHLIF
jgi:hypothetical protein